MLKKLKQNNKIFTLLTFMVSIVVFLRHYVFLSLVIKILKLVFGFEKAKKSSLKFIRVTGRLLIAGFFLVYFVSGANPLKLIFASLTEESNIKIVNLYSSEVNTYPQSSDYTLGWWNSFEASGKPDIGYYGSLRTFSDLNSTFYLGGDYSLIISSFNTDENIVESVDEKIRDFVDEEATSSLEHPLASSASQYIEETSSKSSEDLVAVDERLVNDNEVEISEIVSEEVEVYEEIASSTEEQELGWYERIIKSSRLAFGAMFEGNNAEAETVALESFESEFVSAKIRLSFASSYLDDNNDSGSIDLNYTESQITIENIESVASSAELDLVDMLLELETASGSDEYAEIAEEIASNTEESIASTSEYESFEEIMEIEVLDEEIIKDVEIIENIIIEDEEVEVQIEEMDLANPIEADTTASGTDDEVSLLNTLENLFRIEEAKAQNNPHIIIWYSVDNATNTDDRIWHQLGVIGDDDISNALNQDYLSYEAELLQSWEDISNLQVKLQGVADSEDTFVTYLDALWVEAEYKETTEELSELEQIAEGLLLISKDIDFKINEEGEMTFKYNKKDEGWLDNFTSNLGLSSYWKDIEIKTEIISPEGEALELPLSMIFEEDGEFTIKWPEMSRELKPGKYSIRFTIIDNSGAEPEIIEIEQDFNWGVLAFNTNKSIYVNEETAYLQLAVLDDEGHTLCDADVSLQIIPPVGSVISLSTSDDTIIRNPECGPDNVIDTPDYYAYYPITEIGWHIVNITASTTNGERSLEDGFEVAESVGFDVLREGPTRIYPMANYTMTARILMNEEYAGEIRDYLPEDFVVMNESLSVWQSSSSEYLGYNEFVSTTSDEYKYSSELVNGEQEISWRNLNFSEGDLIEIKYEFDAPNSSPDFFLLGPLQIGNFSESRSWQIASDAIWVATSTAGTHSGWTNPSSAWDNGTDTYASRDIPKKTGTGEPTNYLEATANSSIDIGGTVSTVEIGVEGYVEGTSVTTYLVPYFNGSTAGTTYNITGATVGTTDDNATDYVDITTSANGPGSGNWAWSDIINMNVRVYGGNSLSNAARFLYIDQIRVRVDYTPNNVPTGSIIQAYQESGDSGRVQFEIEVDDGDDDNIRTKIEYESGSGCTFGSPLDPSLDDTDANATSTFGDADIDNNHEYQVGTSTGWIITTSGANRAYFDWLSKSDIDNTEGDYCIRMTANDTFADQASPDTSVISIDNKAPSVPGNLIASGTTKSSITLEYGAVSTDLNFNEYIIYYSSTTADITELDYTHSSTTDINLDSSTFNGEATTTIFGLEEGITYYFAIWAYDDFGHKSSSSVISVTTNIAPNSEFNSALERTDASGIVDFSVYIDDLNNDQSIARIEYEEGDTCAFGSSGDPTLDTGNKSSTYGLPMINNADLYQISDIDTPATNTITFDWPSETDLPNGDNTYCFRFTVNDGSDDQNNPIYATTTIDNVAPTAPGNLSALAISTSSATIQFGATSTETNFLYYKMYYAEGISGVTESDTPHNDSDLDDILFNLATDTTIEDLQPNTDYVVNIWAYDQYGHVASATEINFMTEATISNDSLTFVNPEAVNYAIGDGASEYTFRAVVSEEGGYSLLDTVTLRLANQIDDTSTFDDIKFIWTEATEGFAEIGTDSLNAVVLSNTSTSTCAFNTCTIDFNLVFVNTFATSSMDYDVELYSLNDSAVYDADTYNNFYQVRILKIEQIHYRWRNDDGGE